MGVYDTVEIRCPVCGGTVEFQTKRDDPSLRRYPVERSSQGVLLEICDCSNRGELFCNECHNLIDVLITKVEIFPSRPRDAFWFFNRDEGPVSEEYSSAFREAEEELSTREDYAQAAFYLGGRRPVIF